MGHRNIYTGLYEDGDRPVVTAPTDAGVRLFFVLAGGGARHNPSQPRMCQQPQDHPAVGGTFARAGGLQHPPQEVHLSSIQVETGQFTHVLNSILL